MQAVNLIEPLLVVLVGMAAVMLAAWFVQRAAGNAGWVDVFWTFGAGAACVTAALWPSPAVLEGRQWLVAALAAIWAVRLGAFIAHRVATSPREDARYAGLRAEWGKSFHANMFWLTIVQAPAATLLAWTVFTAAHTGGAEFGVRDILSALVLAIAIAGEGLADEQMRRFKKSGVHGAIMDKGLWGWSRHPNYFFEWFGWLAYPIMAFDPSDAWTWATFVAPVMMFLILRYGTGVPAVEKDMLRSRGDAFRDYQSRVSAFFPLPPRPLQSQGKTT